MSDDEVGHGHEGNAGPSYGWLLVLAGVVVIALVSLLGHHHATVSQRAPRPLVTSSPPSFRAALPAPSQAPSLRPSQGSAPVATSDYLDRSLDASRVCPVKTDGRTTLTVSFELSNPNPEAITVTLLRPTLPLDGLHPRGTTIRTGRCAHPTGKAKPAAGQRIKAHQTVLATMTFGLPKECPQPFPVEATVTIAGASGGVTQLMPLLSDLGGVTFATCPNAA